MRKLILTVFIAILMAANCQSQSNVDHIGNLSYALIDSNWYHYDTKTEHMWRVAPQIINIKYAQSATQNQIAEFEQMINLRRLQYCKSLDFYIYQVAKANEITTINALKAHSIVKIGELNYIGDFAATIPNDPFFASNWYLSKLQMPEAWEIHQGSKDIIVAVVDAGINFKYNPSDYGDLYLAGLGGGFVQDCRENEFTNKLEEPWQFPYESTTGNGIDDDNNGFIDDRHGIRTTMVYQTNNIGYHDNYSFPTNGFYHGEWMADIIGSKINNSFGNAGIAGGTQGDPNSGVRLLSIKVGSDFTANPREWITSSTIAEGVTYAADAGAKVINMSLGLNGGPVQMLEDALSYAKSLGCIIVGASGNEHLEHCSYPASSLSAIAVSGTSIDDNRATWNRGLGGSNSGLEVDISAPGEAVYWDQTQQGYRSGTSYSCAIVSGVVALMASVNPSIRPELAANILETSAEKPAAGNYFWNPLKRGHSKDFGYGRINALSAVSLAQNVRRIGVPDGYFKRHDVDCGQEPVEDLHATPGWNLPLWNSPDIWIRNQPDGIEEHQNPVYVPGQPVFVYVKLRNKGDISFPTPPSVQLFWAKASTTLQWPYPWDGSGGGLPMGGMIGEQTASFDGESIILTFPWMPPNPNLYDQFARNWHFCLLSRLESQDDVMTVIEGPNVWQNCMNNNNIGWRNITITDLSVVDRDEAQDDQRVGGSISFGNVKQPALSDMLLSVPGGTARFNALLQTALIRLEFDKNSWDDIKNTVLENCKVYREDKRQLVITGPNPAIRHLPLRSDHLGTVFMSVNFLSEKQSLDSIVVIDMVSQTSGHERPEVIGGETFVFKKKVRDAFVAYGGMDNTYPKMSTVNLAATDIGEEAVYNWYKSDSVLFTGRLYTLQADSSASLRLEVIARKDGYVSHDTVKVLVTKGRLASVNPNPATGLVTVGYVLDCDGQANFMLIPENGSQPIYLGSYITSSTASSATFDLSAVPVGNYHLSLMCGTEMADTKLLIKQ